MGGAIVGAIAGAFVMHVIAAAQSEGPKFPGDDSPTSGPGCFIYFVMLAVGIVVGGGIGLVLLPF